MTDQLQSKWGGHPFVISLRCGHQTLEAKSSPEVFNTEIKPCSVWDVSLNKPYSLHGKQIKSLHAGSHWHCKTKCQQSVLNLCILTASENPVCVIITYSISHLWGWLQQCINVIQSTEQYLPQGEKTVCFCNKLYYQTFKNSFCTCNIPNQLDTELYIMGGLGTDISSIQLPMHIPSQSWI